MRGIATNGIQTVKSPKFKTSRKAYAWATPLWVNGYKVTIVEKKRRKFK